VETAPASAPTTAASAKDLRHYFRLLRKRWRILAAVAIASGALAFVYTIRQPKVYQSTCSLVLEYRAPQILEGMQDVIDLGGGSYEFMQTQLRIIRSQQIAQMVLDRVGSETTQASEPEQRQSRQSQIYGLLGKVKVVVLRESRIANISARDPDPDRASRIANAFAEAYIERNLDFKLEGARSASGWLGEQTIDLKKKLEDSELAVYKYRKEHNLLDLGLDDRQGMARQNLMTLNAKLTDLKAKRVEAESMRKLILAAKGDIGEKESLPEIRDNSVVTKLRENYLDLLKLKADLESRYGEKHPKIDNIQQQLQATRRDYSHELDEVLKAFDKRYQAILDTETALNKWLRQEKTQALDLAQLEVEYRPMARDAENNAKVFGQVTQRHKEVDLTGLQRVNNVRILDRAMGPGGLVSPNLQVNLTVGLILGLLAGLLVCFAAEALDNTVRTPEAAEEIVGAPLLGVVPLLSEAKHQSMQEAPERDLTVHKSPTSIAAEACRSIRTNLMFMSAQKEVQVLVVTSPGPRDGKTTAAISLAITMAQGGARVLLVDTDLRKPRIHKSFGIKPDRGISNVILGDTTIADATIHTEIPNLDVMPCGLSPPNPAELLHTERFRAILAQLRQSYDKIILDSPPTGPVTDPAILGSVADGVLLVLRAGHTTKEAAAHARRHLADAGARILGLVINQTDHKGGGYGYGYSYYSHYGKYYHGAKARDQAVS
jgi:capsular exopolysaccharide synthesis family protein